LLWWRRRPADFVIIITEPRTASSVYVGPQILITITKTNGERGRKKQMEEERKAYISSLRMLTRILMREVLLCYISFPCFLAYPFPVLHVIE
jgi:hypothetical protein